MTKASYFLFTIVLLAVVTKANSQLLVYHVSKQVHWTHDGKKELAKRGVFLQPGHQISITPQANVMFVQKDGKSMLLDRSGNYTFNQVQLLMQKTKAESISKNFFAYVFEKFLSGDGEEKQRVAAVVYRGKTVMLSPSDSSFVFSTPVLSWKPESVSVQYRVEIKSNNETFDTVLRKTTSLQLPIRFLTNLPQLVTWTCYPADSKQKPPPFLFLIPGKEDRIEIRNQLNVLEKEFGKNQLLLKTMKQDLLIHWINRYRLN
jgi:hypothetical protein